MGVTTEQLTVLKNYINDLMDTIGNRFGIDVSSMTIPEVTQFINDYQFVDSSTFTASEEDVRLGKTFGARGEALVGTLPDVNSTTITSASVTDTNKTLRLYQNNSGYLKPETIIYANIEKMSEIISTFYTQEQLCNIAYQGGITGERLKEYIDELAEEEQNGDD